MRIRSSIQTRFQAAFVLLALAATGTTGWVASVGASAALREATYDRLTAARERRRHALERYFEDLGRHVGALSTSESTVLTLQDLRDAWSRMAVSSDAAAQDRALAQYYADRLVPRVAPAIEPSEVLRAWLPRDPRARQLQYHLIVTNPHAPASADLLVDIPEPAYGPVHARHHQTFQRYLSAFGFYDIFLISAPEGRVLYTVMKEIDIGADLTSEPHVSTGLGRVYHRAMALSGTMADTGFVIDDYAPYVPSGLAPAAFIAAPVRVAGATVGVLAMQISIQEIDRVMTGEQRWRDEGLGETGHAYVIGSDNTLRSDLRPQIEDPPGFYARLARASVDSAVIDSVRRNQTAVLTLPVDLRVVQRMQAGERGTELGVNLFGTLVLRSHAALDIPGLQWALVAEIDADEALAPVRALRTRLFTVGLLIGGVFLIAGGWLGVSVTRPVLELARSVARLGAGARGTTVPVRSTDEIGQLAAAFNRMSLDLERTTVSKAELEVLAGRLISAQEDERRRVARELHDDLVQRLAAAAIDIGQVEQAPPGSGGREAAIDRLKRTLSTLSEDVHRLSRRLHPVMLDELGLVAGIEAECRLFMERGSSPVDVHIEGTFDDLPKEHRLALYRITQEALRNASQYAAATEVSLSLIRGGEAVTLLISDNGVGFSRQAPDWRPGLGLASMEERARLLGGSLDVTSAPGAGTRVRAILPVGPPRVQTEDSAR